MQIVKTNITRNYVPDWGVQEALRELLQNALDQGEHKLSYDNTLIIQTDSYLPISALYMGESTKRDDTTTIGVHGEGLKLALLVLLREGLCPIIRTGPTVIAPRFNQELGLDVLEFSVDATQLDTAGTEIEFSLSESDWVEFNKMHLPADTPTGLVPNSYGKLYLGGLFVGETTYHYSYNFAPGLLKLERDRRVADMSDLKDKIAQLWVESESNLPLILEGLKQDYSDFAGFAYTEVPEWLLDAVALEVPKGAISLAEQWSGYKGTTIGNTFHSLYVRTPVYTKPVKAKKPAELLEEFAQANKGAIHYKKRKQFAADLVQLAKEWHAL